MKSPTDFASERVVPRRFVAMGAALASMMVYGLQAAENKPMDGAAIERVVMEETAQPVRPGIPGKEPFWNAYSPWGFMYAPAFDFKEVEGASSYRFTVEPKAGGTALSFDAKIPWAALSPVWNKVPVGFVKLTVEGMNEGKVVGVAGTRDFYRKAVFDGKGPAAVRGYKECGLLKLKHLYEEGFVQYWLDHDSPDPSYELYCYPSKMLCAIVSGLVQYSRINPEVKDKALTMARHAADFMIRTSSPKDSVYPYFPATYMGEVLAAKGQGNAVMMVCPDDAAMSYLDLYDVTREKCYLEAAERIADTYVKTQLANGTWPIKVEPKSGKILSKNETIPINTIRLFQRLDKQYGHAELRPNMKRALDWILANPIKTFNWEGQFEDMNLQVPYKNLAKGQACDIAVYMLDNVSDNPEYQNWALEIIRYSEDQFVVWSRINPALKYGGLVPHTTEQYGCMNPYNASASDMIRAWAAAYKRTGQEMFRLKAQAMANAMTVSQLPNGELPTAWHYSGGRNWVNCSVFSANIMIELEDAGIRANLPKADESHR